MARRGPHLGAVRGGVDHLVGQAFFAGAAFAVCLGSTAHRVAAAADNKPNVVFILADNVGYGDMGPYGGGELRGFPTPRTDQLAREGMRLTQYLVEPGCTPSRAALMYLESVKKYPNPPAPNVTNFVGK